MAQGITTIALAHHADDQVETFWMRLFRGDVGAGLGGIRWRRNSSEDDRVQIVRPLLNVAKGEITAFARARSVPFREDSSNSELKFQRNRIRHEVLPILEQFQPQLRSISSRAAEVLAAEKEFLEQTAREWLNRKNGKFEELATALQREIVRLQLIDLHTRPSFEIIESLRLNPGQILSVGPELRILLKSTGELMSVPLTSLQHSSEGCSVSLSPSGSLTFGHLEFNWTMIRERGPAEANTEYFDAARLGKTIQLRFWQPGDRFKPIGASGSSKIQDLFTDLKVAAAERRRRIVALSEDGEIFWVEGLRIADAFQVTPDTRTVLRWSWRSYRPQA